MNKKRVDTLLPQAYEILKNDCVGIASKGKINKAYRGQIASFGSAMINGSLLSAVAFFSVNAKNKDSSKSKDDSKNGVSREKLMKAIYYLMHQEKDAEELKKLMEEEPFQALFEEVKGAKNSHKIKEEVENCAIALKLAMNLYQLLDDESQGETNEES